MLDSTVMRGFGEWYGLATFGDFWQNWADAAYMTFAGGYGHIYVLDRTLETAPALQVIIAPIARLAFGLSFPYPSAVLYPTAYWVAGPLYPGWHGPPHLCGRPMAQRHGGHRYPSSPHRSRRDGDHASADPPERSSRGPDRPGGDALRARRCRSRAARGPPGGGWGSRSPSSPSPSLAIPIAFIFLKRRQWLTSLGPIVAVPLAFLIVPVIADPSVTVPQLLHQKVYDVFGYISPTWNLDPGVAAYIRFGDRPRRHPGGDRPGAVPAPEPPAGGSPRGLDRGHALRPQGLRARVVPLLHGLDPGPGAHQRRSAAMVATGLGLRAGGLAHLVAAHRHSGQMVALAHPGGPVVPVRMAGLSRESTTLPDRTSAIGKATQPSTH